jgi:hypothetical protein
MKVKVDLSEVYAADYNDATKRYEVFEYTFKVAE